ncbi:unnamed protein product [Amoebophrya sp. A25]|nr:unnamed protein product [Amoebophrya sp. A25]|eukprot:GSA25T00025137001.1
MASTEVSGTGSIASLQDVSPSSRSTAERASHVAPEEEQPATTDGEIWSWYVYDIGTSVYGAPAMAMLNALLTVRLTTWHACERLSEETPHYCDKDGQPVSGKAGVDKDDVELQTDLLNLTPASVTFLSIGVGVMCQAVAYISFSSYADFGQNRHRLLFRSCVVGVLFAFLFLLCFDSSTWWLASALMILTGVFHGLSIVFYNAYLPLMVRNHPEYTAIQKQQEQTPTNIKNEDIDIINCKGEQDENPNSTSGPQPAAIAEASLATTTSPDDSADPLTLREQSISNHFSTMGF